MKNLMRSILFYTFMIFCLLVNIQTTMAGIPLSSNFTVNTALPIDDRDSVSNVTARDALSALRRWEGMLVYVVSEGKHYTLIGGIANANWTELSGGGGGNLIPWVTAEPYDIGATVIQSNKIYVAAQAHTSGTFATDLANGDWVELSATILTGEATNVGTVVTLTNAAVIAKQLTGYVSAAGTITATDSVLSAIQKLNGNDALAVKKTDYLAAGSILIADGVGTPASKVVGTSDDMFLGVDNASPDKTNWKKVPTRNLLLNPSFEFATFNQGWTCTLGTPTADYTNAIAPSTTSMKITSIGAGVRCYQSISAGAANLKGMQGYARLYVNTTDTVFQVCALVDGTFTANEQVCKTVQATDSNQPFKEVVVPFIMGGTSNGISFKSATTTVQQTFVDEAVVTTGLPNNVKVAGDDTYSAYVTTSTGALSGQNTPWITSCTAANPSICTFKAGIFTQPPNCTLGSTNWAHNVTNVTSTEFRLFSFNTTSAAAIGTIPAYVSCQKTGNDYLSASGSGFAQENSNTDEVAWTPTFGAGWGTVSPSANQCRAGVVGGMLKGRCIVTMGTPANALYSLTLPSGFTIDTTRITANNTTANPGQKVGTWQQSSCRGEVVTATATSASTIYLGSCSAPYLTPIATNASFNTQLTAVDFEIPVTGRSNVFNMIGNFANMEKCANDYECTDEFKVQVGSTGTRTNEPLAWISSIGVASNVYTVNFNTNLRDGVNPLTSSMICSAVSRASGSVVASISASSSTSVQVTTYNSSTGAANPANFDLKCSKGAVDSKPKTAKIADPTGVSKYKGETGVIYESVISYYTTTPSAPCTASPCTTTITGKSATGVVRLGTGGYRIDFDATYSSAQCVIQAVGGAATSDPYVNVPVCTNCSSIQLTTTNGLSGAGLDTLGTVSCTFKQ